MSDLIVLILGFIVVAVGMLAVVEKLPYNPIAGIRTRTVLETREAWFVGNRAGASWLIAGGGGLAAAGLFFVANDVEIRHVVYPLAVLWALLCVVLATRRAHSAVRSDPARGK